MVVATPDELARRLHDGGVGADRVAMVAIDEADAVLYNAASEDPDEEEVQLETGRDFPATGSSQPSDAAILRVSGEHQARGNDRGRVVDDPRVDGDGRRRRNNGVVVGLGQFGDVDHVVGVGIEV